MRNLELILKNFQTVITDNKENEFLYFNNDNDLLLFIESCEEFYQKSTTKHLEDFEINYYNGNSDEKIWYRKAKYLIEKGYKLT